MNPNTTPEPPELAADETNDLTEFGHKRIAGKSWEFTAGVLKHSMDRIAVQLTDANEHIVALSAESMSLREQLSRAERTIDTLTNRSS